MKSKPFLIKADGNELALELIQQNAAIHQESWLQRLLQDHPQILPVDEIEPIFSPLTSIGREISTDVGLIDNLFISKSGYLVLVETKLWRNSEAKREVIAQAIDYGSALSKWSFQQLDDMTRKRTGKGLLELIQSSFDADPEDTVTEDMIARNLRLGRFLILVVSEKIRESLIDMLNFTNRYPHLATNVGLVELQCYAMPSNPNDILVVPSIVAKTEIIERSIVQVNLVPNVEHQIFIEQKKDKEDKRQGRTPLTEDAFWELLQRQSPESIGNAHQIIDHMSEIHQVVLRMRQSAISSRLLLPDSDQKISLFFITTAGTVEYWPETVLSQFRNAGLDTALAEEYRNRLSNVLKMKRPSLSIYYPVAKIDVPAFLSIVDDFVNKTVSVDQKQEE